MGYRDTDESSFSRQAMGRERGDSAHFERANRHAADHNEPRTGYRPELDERTERYGQYGMVRGSRPDEQGDAGRSDGGRGYSSPDRYTVQSPGAYRNDGREMHTYQPDRFDGNDGRVMSASRGYETDGYRNDGGNERGPWQGGGASAPSQQHRDPDYQKWREEQVRLLDADYDSWRTERYQKFTEDFNQWRTHRASQGAANQKVPGQSTAVGSTAAATSSGSSSESKDPI